MLDQWLVLRRRRIVPVAAGEMRDLGPGWSARGSA